MRNTKNTSDGFSLPTVILITVLMSIIMATVMMVVMNNLTFTERVNKSQQALNIAEAGVNYYLWHMSHDASDYRDGNKTPKNPDPKLGFGPYEHPYYNTNNEQTGTYTLWVKPAQDGSTVVTVRSIGRAKDGSERTIDAKIGAASFASYALVADVEFWFGEDESAEGPIFSNQGVHMDGPSTDTVESANGSYIPQNRYGGDGTVKNGVWCSPSVTDPNCNTRDKSNWLYPRASIDFNQVVNALCVIKKEAFANDNSTAAYATASDSCNLAPASRSSSYVPRYSTGFSARRGYYIELNNDNTYDLYRVNGEDDTRLDYSSALSMNLVQASIPIPEAGVIFVEDNVWIRTESEFSGRVTVAAGRLGKDTNSASINIVGNIKYSNKNGLDAIGLVSEKDIIISPYAPPNTGAFNFEIDGALLAQNGSVTYPQYYKASGSRCTRGWTNDSQKFTFYGSVATRQYWTWNYSLSPYGACGDDRYDSGSRRWVSGIRNTSTNYDRNLYYAPPPKYPITGGYDVLSWREVLNTP